MNNSIQKVTLTIETANGELHKLVVQHPGPIGGNPRYMGRQLAQAVAELHRRADDLLTAYGDQIAVAEVSPTR